jgi:hypothetical protein
MIFAAVFLLPIGRYANPCRQSGAKKNPLDLQAVLPTAFLLLDRFKTTAGLVPP